MLVWPADDNGTAEPASRSPDGCNGSKFLAVAVIVLAVSSPVTARDGECYDINGYTIECGAQCGQTPGTCVSSGTRDDVCLLTYDGYGCHSNQQERCCNPNEEGF